MNITTACNLKSYRNRVYIAGRVTGLPEAEARIKFTAKKLWLQGLGYKVFVPVEVCKSDWSWFRCMVVCIFNLVFRCNKISLLNNWQHSRGARIECKIAKFLKYKEI